MTADFEVLRMYLSSLSQEGLRSFQIERQQVREHQSSRHWADHWKYPSAPSHGNILFIYCLMHWLIMAAEGNQEVLSISAHLLDTLGVCTLKSMKCLMRVVLQKRDLQNQAYNFFQFPMEGIIQMSSSDRWSNNLQKCAAYTPRSVMFYLKVHTHTSAIWSPHPPSEASNKFWFTSEIFAESLPAGEVTAFSLLWACLCNMRSIEDM